MNKTVLKAKRYRVMYSGLIELIGLYHIFECEYCQTNLKVAVKENLDVWVAETGNQNHIIGVAHDK